MINKSNIGSESDIYIEELSSHLPGSSVAHGCLIYHYVSELDSIEYIDKPARVNVYFIILCTKGELQVKCNGKEYLIRENSLFVSAPRTFLDASVQPGSEADIFAIEEVCLSDFLGTANLAVDVFRRLYDRPVFLLDSVQVNLISESLSRLEHYIQAYPETRFKANILRSSTTALLFMMSDILSERDGEGDEILLQDRYKQNFMKFIRILSENYLNEREVKFYAQQMCLTSRYLTTMVRKVSGKTVSEWITQFVIKDATYMLNYSGLSVKEIAYKLNFPSESFFCKYFKKNIGLTPLQYRRKENDRR